MTDTLRWPDDFTDPEIISGYGADLIPLFERMIASGASIMVNQGCSWFSFSNNERIVEFVLRGRLKRGGPFCWEVILFYPGSNTRLGPYFGLKDTTCVVMSGVDDIATITEGWLDGGTVDTFLDKVIFWNKHDTSIPLQQFQIQKWMTLKALPSKLFTILNN
jgi:hypothetical protein